MQSCMRSITSFAHHPNSGALLLGGTRLFQKCDERKFVKDDAGRFRWPEELYIDQGLPIEGEAIAFYQDLPHEGAPVGDGHEKYIIRTDIFYERVDKICTAPNDIKAYEMFRKAEELETDGKSMEAAMMFRRCVKLSPALADVYGL
eukprot:m.170607 g.170607  ORF g.170607 m.170607 type:complete len:146 (-) comp14535_c1_seq2:1501-1938(-)